MNPRERGAGGVTERGGPLQQHHNTGPLGTMLLAFYVDICRVLNLGFPLYNTGEGRR